MNPLLLSCFNCPKSIKQIKPIKSSQLPENQITYFKRTSVFKSTEKISFRANLRYKSSINQLWKIDGLELDSMEFMHCLNLITELVPNRLDAALKLNSKNLKSHKDNGSFHVSFVTTLIEDCVHIRNAQLKKLQFNYSEIPIFHSQTFQSDDYSKLRAIRFSQIFNDYLELFKVFTTTLPSRNTKLLKQLSAFIRTYSKDIANIYLIYEKDIRPKLLTWKTQQETY